MKKAKTKPQRKAVAIPKKSKALRAPAPSSAVKGKREADSSSLALVGADTQLVIPGLKKMPLDKIAEEINALLPKIDAALEAERTYAGQAFKAAFRTGQYLLAAQTKAEKGTWGIWLEKNCGGLSTATAYRYIGLAKKFSHVRNGNGTMTLRQAYIDCGILPKEAPAPKALPDMDKVADAGRGGLTVGFVTEVKSFRQLLQGMQSMSFASTDQVLVEQLAAEMTELMAICDVLRAKTAGGGGDQAGQSH